MRFLVIETASEACSVALFDDPISYDGTQFSNPRLLAHDHRVLGRGHAEHLIPMIAALPEKGRADRILVSVGPGSFTGVRVGVAAARALGVAWNAEVYGYPTLQLVAAMAQIERKEGVTVCMNGGHGEWFVQDYDSEGWPENDARSVPPHEAVTGPAYTYVAGNRAQEFSDLRGRADSVVLQTLPDARYALHIPEATFAPGAPPTPIYGRAPDATPQRLAPSP